METGGFSNIELKVEFGTDIEVKFEFPTCVELVVVELTSALTVGIGICITKLTWISASVKIASVHLRKNEFVFKASLNLEILNLENELNA